MNGRLQRVVKRTRIDRETWRSMGSRPYVEVKSTWSCELACGHVVDRLSPVPEAFCVDCIDAVLVPTPTEPREPR